MGKGPTRQIPERAEDLLWVLTGVALNGLTHLFHCQARVDADTLQQAHCLPLADRKLLDGTPVGLGGFRKLLPGPECSMHEEPLDFG